MLGVTSYLAKSQEECFLGAARVEIKWALGGDPSRPPSSPPHCGLAWALG